MSLEIKLLNEFIDTGKIQNIERALLIVSGTDTEEKVEEYKQKLDLIDKQFQEYLIERYMGLEITTMTRAEELHNFLWKDNDKRYSQKNLYQLTKAIDVRLSKKKKPEGTCQVLTSFYTVLSLRNKLTLNTFASVLEEGRGRHVNSLLFCDGKKIIVENSLKKGFDEKKRPYRYFKPFSLTSLISFTYLNKASIYFSNSEFIEALSCCNKAILINPTIGFQYFSRAAAKSALGLKKSARKDIDKGLELEKEYKRKQYEKFLKRIEEKNKDRYKKDETDEKNQKPKTS